MVTNKIPNLSVYFLLAVYATYLLHSEIPSGGHAILIEEGNEQESYWKHTEYFLKIPVRCEVIVTKPIVSWVDMHIPKRGSSNNMAIGGNV